MFLVFQFDAVWQCDSDLRLNTKLVNVSELILFVIRKEVKFKTRKTKNIYFKTGIEEDEMIRINVTLGYLILNH